MESHNELPLVSWSAPPCPYTVEYSPRTLDDIRLAVVDAFFSLPRGGAEIGGILLGCFGDGRLRILDYRPLDCEHAMGPSFTLSERDHARLAELLADAGKSASERQPVGWYHSHTRSDIFLSEADREIHRRYFPEPWQAALVLRPHAFLPSRAAFFFPGAEGSLGETAGSEFVLEALPVQPAPRAGSAAAGRIPLPPADIPSGAPAITLSPLDVSAPPERRPEALDAEPLHQDGAEPASEGPPEDQPAPVPTFLETAPNGKARRAVAALCIVGGCLAAAGAAFQTRTMWLPKVADLYSRSQPSPQSLYLGLNAIDLAGQLQIHWDRNSPAVRQATDGVLEILDGATPRDNALDPAHLQTGVFTYARRTESVDVTLTARLPDGRLVREATSFLGRSPEAGAAAENPELRKTREDFMKQAAELKSDLNAQTNRTRTLEKSVEEVRRQLKEQQARRMVNQAAGK
jgi:proteasome lid subunit RPN8/RPN11